MAITKLNSLAIPAGTVEPADISYPLTNFSSTGIDDNAASTALTIDLAGNVELNSGNILLNEGATGEASIGIKNGSSTGNQQASIVFYGEDNYYPGQVHIVSRSDNTGPTAGDISFWDYTGSTWNQNVTIKKDGKVGIGLHNPSTVLHLREAGTGSGEGDLILATASDGGNAGLRFRTGTSDRFSITTIGSAGSESLRFRDVNNNSERMRIDASGKVLIGTTDSSSSLVGKLVLNGDINTGRQSSTTGDCITSGGGFSTAYNGIAIMSNCENTYTQSNTGLPSWIVDIGGRAADGSNFQTSTSDTFSIRRVAAGGSLYNASNYFQVNSSGAISHPSQPHILGSPVNSAGSGMASAFYTNSSHPAQGGLSFTNSRITVPVAGIYLITFNTICDRITSGNSRIDCNIYVNGSTLVNSLSNENVVGYLYRCMSTVVKLAANDYIQFNNGDWYNPSATYFDQWRTASVTKIG